MSSVSHPGRIDLHESQNLHFTPVSLAEMDSESTPWLWPERIPTGAVTLFCGDPEIGKSFATLDIAARVSSGAAWPMLGQEVGEGRLEEGGNAEGRMGRGEEGGNAIEEFRLMNAELGNAPDAELESCNSISDSSHSSFITHKSSIPGSVLLLSAEDNARQTILPRLQRMNADLSKIHLLRSIRSGNAESTFSLARDIQELEYAAMTLGDCKLIVIDPITSYLQGTAWTNAVMIRTVLDPLKGLAERTGAAVILVNHLTKTKSAAMYRSLGSISIVGMCRVAWMFTRDSSDPERRLMLPLKNNLVASRKNLSYKITGGLLEWDIDPLQMDLGNILSIDFSERERTARERAEGWLKRALSGGKEAFARTLEADAAKAGISSMSLRRARERLKVISRPIGSTGGWLWKLPVYVPEL